MYTAFYGLREKPFALSPDPRFLYLAGSHREALAHLIYGIEQGEGFISVTGEVGTGKTTLCRTLLERLDGDTELAFLFNPSRTALELLQSICAEFDLPAEGLARRSLMVQLDDFLVEQKQLGKRVLLIIDEAQTLSENTLEQVRLLSNLETSREKLIQILLLGQPELDRKLDSQSLRQLRQRISVRWKLDPLAPEETRAYVRHRIAIAAGEPKELFSEAALREVHRRTGGIPRLVNQLCDRALLAGYAARQAEIRPAQIRAAAREIPDTRRARDRSLLGRSWSRPWVAGIASIALVVIAALAGVQVGRHGLAKISDLMLGRNKSESLATRAVALENPPAVGANAPNLARMIGYVSPPPGRGEYPVGLGAPGSGPNLAAATPGGQPGLFSASTSLAIPAPPKIEVTALAPGLLARLLANRDAEVAMAESQKAILEGFGRRVPALASVPTNVSTLQAAIEDRGLATTSFDGGSIDLLRRLDHPVLLPLTPIKSADRQRNPEMAHLASKEGSQSPFVQTRWLAITGFVGDRARVAGLISGRIVTIPIAELSDHWLETGMIVWERFEAVPELLSQGEQGRGVQWLQRSLAELRVYDGQTNGFFDSDTRSALIRFQRQNGLVADGIAGPLTQIALYGRLDRYPVPRLSGAGKRG